MVQAVLAAEADGATPSRGPRHRHSTVCCPRCRAPIRWPGLLSTTKSGRASPAPVPRSACTRTSRSTSIRTTRTEPGNNQFTADYPGYFCHRLADTLGGTSVIAVGALGRQEGSAPRRTTPRLSEKGRFVTNALTAVSPRPSHHQHDARGRLAVVLDTGREHRVPSPRCPVPRRWSARLPNVTSRSRLRNTCRYRGLACRRRIFTINRSLEGSCTALFPSDRHLGVMGRDWRSGAAPPRG